MFESGGMFITTRVISLVINRGTRGVSHIEYLLTNPSHNTMTIGRSGTQFEEDTPAWHTYVKR